MNDSLNVFAGNRTAKLISASLAGAALFLVLAFVDQAFSTHVIHQGVVEKYWYQGGTVTYGIVPTPKQNEPGAQSQVISASRGQWYAEVKTLTGIELITCEKKPDHLGHKLLYREKRGWFTGVAYGLPSCL